MSDLLALQAGSAELLGLSGLGGCRLAADSAATSCSRGMLAPKKIVIFAVKLTSKAGERSCVLTDA